MGHRATRPGSAILCGWRVRQLGGAPDHLPRLLDSPFHPVNGVATRGNQKLALNTNSILFAFGLAPCILWSQFEQASLT